MCRKNPFVLFISVTLLFCGCIKNSSDPSQSASTQLVRDAQTFFTTKVLPNAIANPKNYRANLTRSLDWKSATTQHLDEGDFVTVPIMYDKGIYANISLHPELAYSLSDLTSLLIIRDANRQFHVLVTTYLPDSAYTTSGTYLLEDWLGNSLTRPIHIGSTAEVVQKVEPDVVQNIQVCNEIDGYNYSPDDPTGGVAWSETSCTTYNLPAQTMGALPPIAALPRPSSARILPAEIVIAPPSTPIANVADYFKCFTNGSSPDHTYSVQICVDQPEPGTREPWGLTPGGLQGSTSASNMVNSGHTFLVLTENDQGNITTRNVGFYPSSSVVPTTTGSYSQGILNNDQAHTYNISLTVNVTGTDFFNILNYVELGNNQGFYYNLFSNNCSTFVINALKTGDIDLPSTQGVWTGGSGDDPGDLGEDIRQMNLAANMMRNTTAFDHPNVGNCN